MRRMAALMSVVAALASPAGTAERDNRVDAQMLLDLDLLREADPSRHRDQGLVERLRLLELLRALDTPTTTPSQPSPAEKGAR